jgi:hypothetical protein
MHEFPQCLGSTFSLACRGGNIPVEDIEMYLPHVQVQKVLWFICFCSHMGIWNGTVMNVFLFHGYMYNFSMALLYVYLWWFSVLLFSQIIILFNFEVPFAAYFFMQSVNIVKLSLVVSLWSIIIIRFTGNAYGYILDLTVRDQNNMNLVYSVLCVVLLLPPSSFSF